MFINFKEIKKPHIWEQFACSFFDNKGFNIVKSPSEGIDGGVDMIIEEKLRGATTRKPIRILVSCKHNALKSEKNVGSSEENNILDRVLSNNCKAFYGFYSTDITSGLQTKLDNCTSQNNVKIEHYFIWNNNEIEKYLIEGDKGLKLIKRFFPLSYKKWCKLNSENKNISIVNSKKEKSKLFYDNIYQELNQYYINDKIRDGLNKSEEYFSIYGAHPKILKHVLRFNLRDKNWPRIHVIEDSLKESYLTDEQIALCKFALFESELRISHETTDKTLCSNIIRDSRRYLAQVPLEYLNSEHYHYLTGRWFLEMWWVNKKSIGRTNLIHALSSFNIALTIKKRWWIQCYKCIVLKLLNNKEFKNESNLFNTMIKEAHEKRPLQSSTKLYRITSYILRDDPDNLKCFLGNVVHKSSTTDFEDSLFNRIEMIFQYNKSKQNLYNKIIQDWSLSLPRD